MPTGIATGDRVVAELNDEYEIDRELAGGGMSRVFVATERNAGQRVVIKVFADRPWRTRCGSAPVDATGDGRGAIASAAGEGWGAAPGLATAGAGCHERFRREIGFLARMSHPRIVPLLRTGALRADGGLFYTMPYVSGETLRDRLARAGRLPPRAALRIALDVADALRYAHAQGVVHRDVKPANVLLAHDGGALITDFGVARWAGEVGRGDGDAVEGLTSPGFGVGTPLYMSPEQALGEPGADPRSDVYSFGCTLYEALAGVPPFASRREALVRLLVGDGPPPLGGRAADVPRRVAAVVHRAMAADPTRRFPSGAELWRALVRCGAR